MKARQTLMLHLVSWSSERPRSYKVMREHLGLLSEPNVVKTR